MNENVDTQTWSPTPMPSIPAVTSPRVLLCCGRCADARRVQVVTGVPLVGAVVELHCETCGFSWHETLSGWRRSAEGV